MDTCLMTVRRTYRGCTVLQNGRPLAWYAETGPALELAHTLADAANLRDGGLAIVEIQHPAGTRQRLARFG